MTITDPPGLRERRKLATRDALREAALRLAVERGYDGVTVEAIAEAAGVSARTFFNYFGSKEEALFGLDSQRLDALVTALADRPADESPLDALHAALDGFIRGLGERQHLWEARVELLQRHPELWPRMLGAFAEFERALAGAISARLGNDSTAGLYPAVVSSAVISAMKVAVHHWRADGGARSLAELFDNAVAILARGLTPPVEAAGGQS